MENPLTLALIISAIGMSLLFLSLAFFYGLLSLLTATIRDKPPAAARLSEKPAGEDEEVLRAAAVAIALARAETEQLAILSAAPSEDAAQGVGQTSPWWTLHHQRQLTTQQNVRRGG